MTLQRANELKNCIYCGTAITEFYVKEGQVLCPKCGRYASGGSYILPRILIRSKPSRPISERARDKIFTKIARALAIPGLVLSLVIIYAGFTVPGIDSRTTIIGGIISVSFFIYLLVSLRREEKARAEVLRVEKEAQAAAELREKILDFVTESVNRVVLGNVAKRLGVLEDEVRAVIEESVGAGVLMGRFSNDGRTFIPDDVLKRIIDDKLVDE